jgi:CRP-like cAMP-binding protein
MWIDAATSFQKSLAALPLTIYQAGETVLAGGSRTDRLLILRKGNVAVVKEGIEIARVTEPGAVFGEISALLDCPHTADVRALANLAVSRRAPGRSARPGRALLRSGDPGTAS